MMQHPGGNGALLSGAGSRERHYAPGEVISLPGDPRNQVLIVQEGKVRVYLSRAGREVTLSFLTPGAVFSTHTRAFLQASEPTRVSLLPAEGLLEVLGSNPQALASLFSHLGRTLHDCFDLIEDFSFRDVEARIARRFCAELMRNPSSTAGEAPVVELDLTGEEIGWLVGASRQRVSSVLSRLCRQGILSRLSRTRYQVCDLAALRALGDD